MALVAWKTFRPGFFDTSQVRLPGGEDSIALDQSNVTCVASGFGNLFVGTPDGLLYALDQSFKPARSWKAHDAGNVTHVAHVPDTPFLVTLAETLSREPELKVWKLDQNDKKTGYPRCLCTLTVQNGRKNFPVTAFVVISDLSQVAVGFGNGAVTVVRGDFIHDRGTKQRTVFEQEESITGLEFREANTTALYIATTSKIYVLVISGKAQGTPARSIDERGCALGCLTLDQQTNDIIVARDDAIYMLGPHGKANSYAFEGSKKFVGMFKDYILITSPPLNNVSRRSGLSATGPGSTNGMLGGNNLTVLSTELKLIAHSESVPSQISHVFTCWGDIFLLTIDGKLYRYHEKTLQQKLEMAYQRELYVLAITMARKYKVDAAQQNVIFRRYGDWLYQKGDYDTAMQQYLRAIDNTEPSQVIRKFLDHQRIENLIDYLEELHEHEKATSDHTTLLLNCYAKLQNVEKLEEFIKQPGELKFDLDTAIVMCRQAGYYDQAAFLARRHDEHGLVVDILIEDLKRYAEALAYIVRLEPKEAYPNFMKYGTVLLDHCPKDTTQLLIDYFTGVFRPKKDAVIEQEAPTSSQQPNGTGFGSMATTAAQNLAALIPLPYMSTTSMHLRPSQRGDNNDGGNGKALKPQIVESVTLAEFIPYTAPKPRTAFSVFIDHPDPFIDFLEACIQNPTTTAADRTDLHTTLFEIYLHKASTTQREEQTEWQRKARALLASPDTPIDTSNVLLLSDLEKFRDGTLLVSEKQGLRADIFRAYTSARDTPGAIRALHKYGPDDPALYPAALAYFTSSAETLAAAGPEELDAVLQKIDADALMAPLQVIQTLSSTPIATMGLLKRYLARTVANERSEIAANRALTASFRADTLHKQSLLSTLTSSPAEFRTSRCAACANPLALPTIHFLCAHSFHQHCLDLPDAQADVENNLDVECPLCAPRNRIVRETRRAQEMNAERHEVFANSLAVAERDRFGVVAEWFGRGVVGASAAAQIPPLQQGGVE